MAKSSGRDNQSGHLSAGGPVTSEQRPPGPVPLRRLTRLGDKTAGMNNPHGVGPVSKTVMVGNNGGKTY